MTIKRVLNISKYVAGFGIPTVLLALTVYAYVSAYTGFIRDYSFRVQSPFVNPFVIEPREARVADLKGQ